MEIMDIIKESFIFPSKNLEQLAIYIVLTFVIAILSAGGAITSVFGIVDNSAIYIIAFIFLILSLVVRLILSGYQINLIKSGIGQDEDAPGFAWKDNIINGIKKVIVTIVYFIIPAVIVLILAFAFNIPNQFLQILEINKISMVELANMTSANTFPVLHIPDAIAANFLASIAIVGLIALVLFIIFAFLESMGEARLANTGELSVSLNMIEAYKDITRIGFGKVVATIILVGIIVAVINGIVGYITGQIQLLSIITVVITPYITFFTNRSLGLLYSDIA